MNRNRLLELLDLRKIVTRRKLAEAMGAAAAVGVAAGTLFTLKAGKRMREEFKKVSNTVTIEMHGLEGLKIERIGKIDKNT